MLEYDYSDHEDNDDSFHKDDRLLTQCWTMTSSPSSSQSVLNNDFSDYDDIDDNDDNDNDNDSKFTTIRTTQFWTSSPSSPDHRPRLKATIRN